MALTLCFINRLNSEPFNTNALLKIIMFKKRLCRELMWSFLCLLSASLFSCSEADIDVPEGQEITTSVTVEVPEVFRSRSIPNVYPQDAISNAYLGESGYSSVKNLDLQAHPLSFTVGVYVKKTVDGNPVYIEVDKQERVNVTDDKADFNFQLMEGQKYHIVAYADFSGAAKADLENIAITPALNKEENDAFFVSEEFTAREQLAVVLKRPFGKLRLIARDFSIFAKGENLNIKNVKVTYDNTAVALATNSFNAITGEFNNAEGTVTREFTATPAVYSKEYDKEEPDYATVFTMYLPANFGTEDNSGTYTPDEAGTPVPQSWMYPFNIEVTYENAEGQSTTLNRSFNIDIPVKRNWLTTIDVANFYTDNSDITVTIDPRFDGTIIDGEDVFTVSTERDLRKAIADIEKRPTRTGRIVLENDITLTSDYYGLEFGYYASPSASPKAAPFESETVTLDLNGHKLTGTKLPKYTQALIGIYGPVDLTIEDTSPGANGVIESPVWLNADGKYESIQTIVSWRYGSKITVNDVAIKVHQSWNASKGIYQDLEAIYLGDPIKYVGSIEDGGLGLVPSQLIINSGWFECVEVAEPKCLINLFNGKIPPHPEDIGYGRVWIRGGSFVGFNPANGDNVSGTTTNKWVDDNHTVLTNIVNGKTVYTVIPDSDLEYH